MATAGCRKDEKDESAPRRVRIALIGKSGTNPVFAVAREGAETAARALSAQHNLAIEIVWLTPPEESAERQATRVGDAVREGMQAIIVSCSDAEVLTPAIDQAVARGVPVMTFDSDAPGSRRFAFAGVGDVALGERLLAELASALGQRGQIAILAGSEAAPNLRQRVAGVKNEAAKHPGLEIVATAFHAETGPDAIAALARVGQAHEGLDGWVMLGGWALGEEALPRALGKPMPIVGVGGLPAHLAAVERGLAPVLLAPPMFEWGKRAVETVIDRIHLDKTVPAVVPLDVTRVTREGLPAWRQRLRSWKLIGLPEQRPTSP